MSNIILIGIDLAKNVFQLHGVDALGKPVLRKKLSRAKLIETVANMPRCTIAMEACSGANYWYRKFSSFGHEVKLISPQLVKPFVKTNKNDKNDAEAICEDASRPTMRFVSPKSIEQEDLQAMNRIRNRLIQERTGLANQMRGLLAEYGIVISQGMHKLRQMLPEILEDATNELSYAGRELFNDLYHELLIKEQRVEKYNTGLDKIFKANEMCQRISKIEGVGPIIATAIVATIGDRKVFKNGRHFSAYLGLVPRQSSTGGKERLLGISKRGNIYIRYLLIHGGCSVVHSVDKKDDSRSKWVKALKERKCANKEAVVVANKNARIIWALLAKNEQYRKAA